MTAKEQLARYIEKILPLDHDEINAFTDAFKEAKIKKRQFIVQPGFTAKYRNFIIEGAFRSYVIGDSGTDHTVSFGIKDWWITDYNSYIYEQPATMFVMALEDAAILQIEFEKEAELKQSNHKFETIFRITAERGLAFQQRRMVANLTLSAEERYDQFVTKHPDIVQHMPQYALASYLGMTTEFLSKIRNKKVRKKS